MIKRPIIITEDATSERPIKYFSQIVSKTLLPGLFIYQQRYETKIYDKRLVDAYDVSLLDLDDEGGGSIFSFKTVENSEEISGKKE